MFYEELLVTLILLRQADILFRTTFFRGTQIGETHFGASLLRNTLLLGCSLLGRTVLDLLDEFGVEVIMDVGQRLLDVLFTHVLDFVLVLLADLVILEVVLVLLGELLLEEGGLGLFLF